MERRKKPEEKRVFSSHLWWPKQLPNFILFEPGVSSLHMSTFQCFCLHPWVKWARSSKARGRLGRSGAQQPRKASGHCFFDMFCMYLRNRIFWPAMKGPKGQAQGLHTGSGVFAWWALNYFDISLFYCIILISVIRLRWKKCAVKVTPRCHLYSEIQRTTQHSSANPQ